MGGLVQELPFELELETLQIHSIIIKKAFCGSTFDPKSSGIRPYEFRYAFLRVRVYLLKKRAQRRFKLFIPPSPPPQPP